MFCHVLYRNNNLVFSREYIYLTVSRDYSTIQDSQLRLRNGDCLCFLFCRNSMFSIISVLYCFSVNPLKPELNPICYLLVLLAHHFLHVSRIRVKSLTFRRLMSYIYIYGAPILDVSRSHTTTQHSR